MEVYAKKYLECGIMPHPLRGKIPKLENWVNDYPKTPEEIESVFTEQDNIGIVCGKASGGLEGVDVDTKHDLSGSLWEELISLIQDNIDQAFVIVETPSGGKHIIYRCENPGRNTKLAQRHTTEQEKKHAKDNVRVLIETRGEGGQLCAYPSLGYKLVSGSFEKIPFLSNEERECLMVICKSFNDVIEQAPEPPKRQGPAKGSSKSPFADFNEKAYIPDILQNLGWSFVYQRGQKHYYKRPGDTKAKTSGNYHEGHKLFWAWTTSSELPNEKPLSAVDLWMLSENISDKKEAYKQLLADGYGEPFKKDEEPEEQETQAHQEFKALNGTPYFENWIFEALPYPLNKICGMYEGRERDMSLIMSLTTCSAILCNVKGLYHGKETHANLYGIAIATAGTGKGIFNYARALGYATIQEIKAENESALQMWEHECETEKQKQGKGATLPDQPKQKKPFISANATSKGLINQMSINGDLGTFAIETEIDSVANMIKTEHGDITSVLRNAWEHEDIGTVRATSESNDIENPKLSLLLAGTPGQLHKLFPDAENGLFSRCMLYAYKTRPVFKNPVAGSRNYKEIYKGFSSFLESVRTISDCDFSMTQEQGDKLAAKYDKYLLRYYYMNGDDAISIVLRMGKQVFKIAMILQRLSIGQDFAQSQNIKDEWFDLALSIGDTLLKHSFNVFDMLFARKAATAKKTTKEQEENTSAAATANDFYDALPLEFTTKEYKEIGRNMGQSDRTCSRNIKKYVEKGLMKKTGHGLFSKVEILE